MSARLVCSWVAFAALGGCLDPTQATIDVTTNVPCGGVGGAEAAAETFHETGIVAGTDDVVRTAELQTSTDACTEGSDGIATIGSMVLYPRDGARFASVVVVGAIGSTTAEDCLERIRKSSPDVTNCIIARRSIAFIEHEDLHVPVLLDRSCAGVRCGEDETCVVTAGKPACVSAETVCTGSECNPTTVGSGGGSTVTTGSGGSGGASGSATFETLPSPAVNNGGAKALGVSDDGEIVVGLTSSGLGVNRPVAWRDGMQHVLETGNGIANEACGDTALVVGNVKSATKTTAKAWRWNAESQAYDSVFTAQIAADSSAVDCDVLGQKLLITAPNQALIFSTTSGAASLGQAAGTAWEMSSTGRLIVGGDSLSSQAQAWSVESTGLINAPTVLPGTPGTAYAVNASGSLVAGYIDSHLVVWRFPSLAKIYDVEKTDFSPNAIVGTATNWLAVGTCDVSATGRACVVDNGQGPYDIDGLLGDPWPKTIGTDFKGLSLTSAEDASQDGKVIVGVADNPTHTATVAYRLRLE